MTSRRLITIGSDAHAPEHIAYDFATATILKEIGFDTGIREKKGDQLHCDRHRII